MITLPAIFSDGMVVGKRARIFGSAPVGEAVRLTFMGKTQETLADRSGKFAFELEALPYGGPHEMIVGDRVIRDVYVGHLWLCGGQSNMEQPLERARALLGDCISPLIQLHAFQVTKDVKFDAPAQDVTGQWNTAAGDFLQHLYAVPYFFAKLIIETLNDGIHVGLINIAAGGTPIEGWLPEEIIREYPALYEKLETVRATGYMENLQKENDEANRIWYEQLTRKDKCATGEDGWHTRMLLDDTDLPHGAVWYKKKVAIGSIPNSAVTLSLGRAQDSVKVYVNGTEVKSVDYQYPPCLCEIPEEVLRQGENEIALRLIGNGQKPKFIAGKEYSLAWRGDGSAPDGRIPLDGEWLCRVGVEMPLLAGGAWFYGYPCCVYNYMLAPVLGVQVDGVIWYQGESNVGNPTVYKELFTRFITMLRQHSGENLPVYFTQLADYVDPNNMGENWAFLREAQRNCLEIPNTRMAVAIDCGEYNDLHPQDKKTVGERLALHALRNVYGLDIQADGPTVFKATQKDNKIIVCFDHARGLWAKNGRPLVEVETHEGIIHRLYAAINGQTLTINVGSVPTPVKTLRYAWADCPPVTLYNAHNLPASPFEIAVT
ncbi:MAG: sialate O-acetylesterase [Defluviitaleaceae bacterium]|nr:sialate O-acetylesterase [Defluviitaleaceae bacterium]MCL2273885.1 sialate O-acetylesterase [Defluviitaleaceae bacterium]